MLAVPPTRLSTGSTQVSAQPLAMPMPALCRTQAGAGGAGGPPMTWLATCVPTQQVPAAHLAAR